jgi:hypothetical protein
MKGHRSITGSNEPVQSSAARGHAPPTLAIFPFSMACWTCQPYRFLRVQAHSHHRILNGFKRVKMDIPCLWVKNG